MLGNDTHVRAMKRNSNNFLHVANMFLLQLLIWENIGHACIFIVHDGKRLMTVKRGNPKMQRRSGCGFFIVAGLQMGLEELSLFPSFLFPFSCLFLRFFSFFSSFSKDKGKRLQFTGDIGNFTPTPSAPILRSPSWKGSVNIPETVLRANPEICLIKANILAFWVEATKANILACWVEATKQTKILLSRTPTISGK